MDFDSSFFNCFVISADSHHHYDHVKFFFPDVVRMGTNKAKYWCEFKWKMNNLLISDTCKIFLVTRLNVWTFCESKATRILKVDLDNLTQ